jgi:deoxycytidylate deaminase
METDPIKYPFVPTNIELGEATIEHPDMRMAFEHAMKHQRAQAASGMRAVTSVLVARSGERILGVAGELTNHVDGHEDELVDDLTWHAKYGRCDRVQLDGNVDYDKCPGCRHDRHSERSVVRKALRDGVDLTDAEIYLYGQWWICESCANAAHAAGVRKIYLLPKAYELFDRSREGQAERLAAFQKENSDRQFE